MNLAELQKKLIAAARLHPPGDRVPYAFEKRIIALITARAVPDRWAIWSRALWRGAAGCLAFVLLLGAFSFFTSQQVLSQRGNSRDLSQDFERTMLASAVQSDSDNSW